MADCRCTPCVGVVMRSFHPADYGPVLAPLVSGDRNRPLDHGRPDPALRSSLQLATVKAAYAHAPLADEDIAAASIAGLWLVHDFLDESHTISQNIETPTGSFWHGIMHRREGDFSNARYWLRRVGAHEVLNELGAVVANMGQDAATIAIADRLASGGQFDPYAMVDLCQSARRGAGPEEEFCRRVQQAEWELLFDFCYRGATGA
jgi:hypothetical protein